MKDETYDLFLDQELPTARELKSLFPTNADLVIFDIGACEGEDSIRYATLFPNALIYAFEPLRANQTLIEHHFARHQVKRCLLVPLALSNRRGEATLHVSSGAPEIKYCGEDWNYGNKSNSLLAPNLVKNEFPWLKFEKTEVVQTETLDHFCELKGLDRVDFLHIDVQGAESLVLQGAEKMLPKIRALWLEVAEKEVYEGQKLKGDMERFMQKSGFRMTSEDGRGVEGDQFYVNMRFQSGRRKFWISRIKRVMGWPLRLLRRLARFFLNRSLKRG